MTARILAAAPVVEQIKKDLIQRCESLKQQGHTPSMCVVLVGNNPASMSYIRNKKKMCEEIGAQFRLEHLDETISADEFLKKMETLNNDPSINGIIIQLPVSDELKNLALPNLVKPSKDIDGFHGMNTQNLYLGSTDLSLLLPCTPKGIVNLLKFYQVELKGKNVVVVGRSLIVGKPLSMLLSNFDATVTMAHSQTKNLRDLTRQADIVISAIGKAHFFDRSYFAPEKHTIVVDVGMNSLGGKLTGDVDQHDVMDVVRAITPVPGGVGPMTVVSLIQNLISATENQLKG
ncbi:bifunctional 5,10-methylenetetrahydrofolate dehydrogenase/5,10-methenyltetrahydrofolate cyclohydrolase [Peredibacter starrii]|uniref:Bifunctional protein FolD n=1 Tax=Peredibacter starrii TaxID=28202 RepID=A0AAX4HQE6_9BACT|nr:bifunctional 5,10-methylenetetrahydrofolate dehydrogenase/5,10-methenyltetrahydrofolate cyclohydrolase [Peredibacter starrii]WPU65280.1 bifunctional 5,10-methylenetetrahydrofolate dehydrogenase/5,10-methenyltetrahydrofolate cyclohydrolase [Peredibacter starrii]